MIRVLQWCLHSVEYFLLGEKSMRKGKKKSSIAESASILLASYSYEHD